MEVWHNKKLEDIGTIYSGSTPSTTNPRYWDGNIVWVTPNDLSKLRTPYLYTSDKSITKHGLNSCSTNLLPAGSITISSRAPIGYVAIPQVEFCTNQGCKSIRLKEQYDSEFVYYNICFNIAKLKNLGTGTTFTEISKAALSKIEMSFPDGEKEQTQIATILSTIDEAIEQTEAIIEKQTRIKQGLMQDLFRYGIDEKGRIRSETTHQFKNTPLGRIPKEWKIDTIKRTAYLRGRIGWQGLRSSEFIAEGPYLVTGTDFDNAIVSWERCYHVSFERFEISPDIHLREGDLLITKDGTIGKIAIVRNCPKHAVLNSGIFLVRPINSLVFTNNYMYHLLSSFIFDKFLKDTQSGSTINHLYQNVFEHFLFPIPSIEEQFCITSTLSQAEQAIQKEETYKQKLLALKRGFMEDLLSGRVRVKHLIYKKQANG